MCSLLSDTIWQIIVIGLNCLDHSTAFLLLVISLVCEKLGCCKDGKTDGLWTCFACFVYVTSKVKSRVSYLVLDTHGTKTGLLNGRATQSCVLGTRFYHRVAVPRLQQSCIIFVLCSKGKRIFTLILTFHIAFTNNTFISQALMWIKFTILSLS